MKTKLLLAFAFSGLLSASFGQQNNNWEKWSWLIGEWAGEGSGQPGEGGGTFSFTPELDNNVLIRKSHSEYPATENKPRIVHNDLMIVYPDLSSNQTKAIYFDNEGHTINYKVSYSEKSIVLTSEKVPGAPIFRLTYTLLENATVNTNFEMSQDGVKFMLYIQGKSKKQN